MFLNLNHQFGLVNASMQKWVFSGDHWSPLKTHHWSGCVCVCVWEHQGNLATWKLFKAVFTTLTGISVGVDWRYCKLGSPLYGGGSDSLPSAFVSFGLWWVDRQYNTLVVCSKWCLWQLSAVRWFAWIAKECKGTGDGDPPTQYQAKVLFLKPPHHLNRLNSARRTYLQLKCLMCELCRTLVWVCNVFGVL